MFYTICLDLTRFELATEITISQVSFGERLVYRVGDDSGLTPGVVVTRGSEISSLTLNDGSRL